ncbi:MAG: hypothetical protein E7157_01820 [Lactobacillales bacterium]|nr:hypothetical protein [Lactobacillales bacterium]
MLGFYNIKELTIGQMSIINKTESSYEHIPENNKFILRKIPGLCNSWQYNYEEIFTHSKYRSSSSEVEEKELYVERCIDIKDYLTEKELKIGFVSKHRLYKIYKTINYKENKISELREVKHKRKHLSLHNV